jgi:hypothetical protein
MELVGLPGSDGTIVVDCMDETPESALTDIDDEILSCQEEVGAVYTGGVFALQ